MQNAAMDLSSVPEALVTSVQPRDKIERQERRQGRTWRLIFWKRQGKVAKTQLSQTFADKLAARKSKSTCHECGQRGHWAGDLNALEMETQNFTIWPNDQSFPDREDSRTIMVV